MTYPEHIYDETRRNIAVSYIRHELRKLFPSIKTNDAFSAIDTDVAAWFSNNPTLAPVRDFWNGVHGISMGFRLKHIGTWLTSENILWEEKEIEVKNIRFRATFEELAIVGVQPTVEQVRDWYFNPEHKEALETARQAHIQRSNETANRDAFPVILRRLLNEETIVMDGNRRLLRAILFSKEKINAYIGSQTENPPLKNNWVPTSLLLDLVSMHRYWNTLKKDSTDFVAKTIAEMIRDSECARFEFFKRSIDTNNASNQELSKAVEKILAL